MVVTRWDPNKSGNRERTETEWLVLPFSYDTTSNIFVFCPFSRERNRHKLRKVY